MKRLVEELQKIPEAAELLHCVGNGGCPAAMTGVGPVHRAHLCAALLEETGAPELLLCSDEGEARRMAADMAAFTGISPVLLPPRALQFHVSAAASRAWEQERIVLNLALDRILYPVSMTDEAKEKYLIYIKEHIQQAIRLLGEQKAYDSMQRILRKLAPDRAETEKMLETAQSANDSRCVSILMNELQKHGRKQRKAFEL